MDWVASFYRSTIGKKIIMAVTGAVLVLFVIAHSLGNLLAFQGPDRLNAYAHFLKSNAGMLWTVRLVLLASVVFHVQMAWQLTRLDRTARPVGYAKQVPQASTLAARTIRWGGVLLLVFIVFHLLHFTTGTLHPSFSTTDVFANVVTAFRVPWVTVFYVAAMAALGFHLYHGVWSAVQTLGWNHPHYNPLRRRVATVLAVVIFGAFAAIPLAVAAGIIR
ncbi:MAG: succinate dehydrogenase cytochrome b subunit [Gemmatimonadota bacterium]